MDHYYTITLGEGDSRIKADFNAESRIFLSQKKAQPPDDDETQERITMDPTELIMLHGAYEAYKKDDHQRHLREVELRKR